MIKQENLITAIEETITLWKDLQKESLRGNIICPLCNLIKTTYKVSFQKGSARGACLLCPVKYFGKFYLCIGIEHVYSTSTITTEEMKSLRTTIINSLTDLKAAVINKENYKYYNAFASDIRKGMILDNSPGVIKSSKKASNATKSKRVYKTGRSR